MRIAKYIANAGYCSRRDAEKLIYSKKVYINNEICKTPSMKVLKNDIIKINDKQIIIEKKIKLWKLYKPTKIICTNKDPQKRKTIFEIIPKNMPRTISIGRLDYMSEGLILLTNNGDFARKLELPSSNFIRVYRVCIASNIDKNIIYKIEKGISINGFFYKNVKIKIEKKLQSKTWLIFKLYEGKNREIRNICKYFKWPILKLIRLQYGPIKINKEKPGQIIEIKPIPKKLL